jgi:heterodisulfide reductase subunit A
MRKDVVIIGAGITGLCCSMELSKLGIGSVIVERSPFVGGHVTRFCCKATEQCQRCGACLLDEVMQDVRSTDKIITLRRTTVVQAVKENGRFILKLRRRPSRIDLDKCTDCSKCLEVCPESGSLVHSPEDHRIYLNEQECRFYVNGGCKACLEACPEDAISLEMNYTDTEIEASVVIAATGFKPFDPREKARFGYGRVPGVITALELDSMLRSDDRPLSPNGNLIESVAFIQCVGSRDVTIGRNYCSRVCCGYAIRLARFLKHRFPRVKPSMFYMDIQTYDRDFEARIEQARREMRLIRSMPSEIRSDSEGRPLVTYRGHDDKRVSESFDMVVLSIGISPEPSVAEILGIGINDDGFMNVNGTSEVRGAEGVFAAGTAQGPGSIADSVSHSTRIASLVVGFLRETRKGDI